MSNKQFDREQVFSKFINDGDFCESEDGKSIGPKCLKIKENLAKELGQGCSSCRKGAIYSKYRQIIYAKLIAAGR